MSTNGIACLMVGGLVIGAAAQTYPGQPTKGQVWIENRGRQESIPVTLEMVATDGPLRTQIVGTPAVTIAQPTVFETRETRRTWEYKVVTLAPIGPIDTVEAELNRLGRDGWEIAGQWTDVGGQRVALKRPR